MLFKSQIFMGNKVNTSTEASIIKLYELVDEALKIIDVNQQTKLSAKKLRENSIVLELLTEDIVMALTGKKIKFINEKKPILQIKPKKQKV